MIPDRARERDLEKEPAAYGCAEHLAAAGFGPVHGTCCAKARPLYRRREKRLEEHQPHRRQDAMK